MYATLEDFKRHYQEKGEEIIATEERLLSALKNAASEMNIYLSPVYVLPITRTVPYLRWANCVIAVKMLAINGESDKDRADYDDAIATLRKFIDPRYAAGLVDSDGKGLPLKNLTPDIGGKGVSSSVKSRTGYYINF